MYKRGLYHDWVPKPVQLLMIFMSLFPLLVVSGVYVNNINDMVGGMGAMPEVFSLANYASFIGMATVMPLLLRTKQYFRSKEIVVGSLLLLCLLSWVCYSTDDPNLIVFASFFIGVFKMFGLIEFILPIYFIISPTMDRTRFYPIFYPISILGGQLFGYYFSLLAYNQNWQYVYLFIVIYMLVCALLAVILMHNSRGSKKVPLYQFSWLSMIWFAVIMMVLNYILVYTKFHGWFQAPVIRWGLAAFLLMSVGFIIIQKTLKRPFLSMNAFKRKNVYSSLIMIALMGIYLGSSSLQSTFMIGVLQYSFQLTAFINLAMVPGIIIGGILSFVWFKNDWNLKGLVLIGFGSYLLAQLIIYFLFVPEVQIGYFIFPTILKGLGLCVLYISLASYCTENLSMADQIPAISVLVLFRSFLGPALFGSILSWVMYKLQIQNVTNIATQMDATDSFALIRGGGMGLYGTVQIQSILLAVKKLFGFTIVAGIIVMIYVGLHRFNPIHHRRRIFISKLTRGESIKGYRLYGSLLEEEEAMEEALVTVV